MNHYNESLYTIGLSCRFIMYETLKPKNRLLQTHNMKLLIYVLISIMFCLLSACSLLLTDPLEYPNDQFVEQIEDMDIDMFEVNPNVNPNDLEITGNQTYVDAALQDLGINDQMVIDGLLDQTISNDMLE